MIRKDAMKYTELRVGLRIFFLVFGVFIVLRYIFLNIHPWQKLPLDIDPFS